MTVHPDHFDGSRYRNPFGRQQRPFSAVPKMLREPRQAWPASRPVAPQVPPPLNGAPAVVTFVGHSTFLIQTAAGAILTDPVFGQRAGPYNLVGPKRVRQPGVRFEDLPPVRTVLLSHNHYDHCDLGTLKRLARRFDPTVVTLPGNRKLVASTGIRRIIELNWWESGEVRGMEVTATPAQHFSARTPWDRNRALWGGFTFIVGGKRIYFAGDTAYVPIFSSIRQRMGRIDLALLPIGAYEPRWFMGAVHMDPAEAVQAHLDLDAHYSIGMHFGTFRLTAEGIDDPLTELDAARRAHGIPAERFRALDFGGSFTLPR